MPTFRRDPDIQLERWHLVGEWYQRGPTVAEAADAGGFTQWLRALLPADHEWTVQMHAPFA
ncbi:MAG: hypothetical protein R2705_01520 [Ilumatobacteraceae bacterium]